MTPEKSPLEQALDLVLYAPVGLALSAREELPRLVEKGRQRIANQVTMARMVGQFALAQGQHEATKAIKQATDVLIGLGIFPGESPPPARPARPEAPSGPSPTASNGKPAGEGAAAMPANDGLAIPGYDSLSASQVVQRLAGLAPGELEAVRVYEVATRGRRTILTKIVQLQAGTG